MNTDTGEVYELGLDAELGEKLKAEHLIEQAQEHESDRLRALEAIERGESIVRVSDDVAHQLLVGQKELERRKRRRRSGGVVGH